MVKIIRMIKKISLIYGSERFSDVFNDNLIVRSFFTSTFTVSLHRKPITRRKFDFGIKICVTKFYKGRKRVIEPNDPKTIKNRKESEDFNQQKQDAESIKIKDGFQFLLLILTGHKK